MSIYPAPIVIGCILSIAGFVFLRFPPKTMNRFYGYRTPQAYRDHESWVFAQRYSAKLMACLGGLSAIICFLFYITVQYFGLKIESTVITWLYHCLPGIAAVMSIVLTELALTKMKKK